MNMTYPSSLNSPLSVSVTDENGQLKEYHLAFAAVRMSTENAMEIMSSQASRYHQNWSKPKEKNKKTSRGTQTRRS